MFKHYIQSYPNIFAVVILLLSGVVFYWPFLFANYYLGDEEAYFNAFKILGQGQSPYNYSRYLYPPAFAWFGNLMFQLFSEGIAIVIFRFFNLAGAVLTIWLSFTYIPIKYYTRVVFSILLLFFSPPVYESLTLGNISPLVSALIIASLQLFIGRPLFSGFLMGLSLMIKPTGVLAALCLSFVRDKSGYQLEKIVLFIIPLIITLIVLFSNQYTGEMFGQLSQTTNIEKSNSFNAVLKKFSLEISPLIIAGIIFCFVCYAALNKAKDYVLFYYFLLAAMVFSAPVIWGHSMVLIYPVLCRAVFISSIRYMLKKNNKSLLEFLVIFFLVLNVFQMDYFRLVFVIPEAIKGMILLLPHLFLLLLLFYLFIHRGNKINHSSQVRNS